MRDIFPKSLTAFLFTTTVLVSAVLAIEFWFVLSAETSEQVLTHLRWMLGGLFFASVALIAGWGMLAKRVKRNYHHWEEAERIMSEHRDLIVTSAKMGALGEMASGIAHEINNPLTVILTKTDEISFCVTASPVDRVAIQSHLSKIATTVNRITKIIRGLGTFARDAGRDPFEVVSVRSVIDDTLSFCQERMRQHGVEIEVKIDIDAKVSGRPSQLSQVLLNLLSNAFDALEGSTSRWIRIEVVQVLNLVEIAVVDSGHGISMDVRQKMFQPFFTTKPVGKGTGLGLGISKGLMEVHRGTLTYDGTSPNTRFVIRLPVAESQQQDVAA